ncbi:MAG: hypothetical protein Q4C30_01460 [Bacteroidia bacterium]|nr:hypothetical protein [Bacteroidia bacterium]
MKKKIILVLSTLALLVQFVGAVKVSSIAEYAVLADETEVTFTCRLAVLAQKGMKLFVSDGQRGAVIYGKIDQTFEFGDLLESGLTAKKITFDYAPEMVQVKANTLKKANSSVNIKPVRIAMSDVSMDKVYCYTRLMGHYDATTSMLSAGGQQVLVYNHFNKEMPKETGKTTVDGILIYYKRKNLMELYVM